MIYDDDPVQVGTFREFKYNVNTKLEDMLYEIVCLAVDAEKIISENNNKTAGIVNQHASFIQNIIDYVGIPDNALYKGFP